jgi:hypothetical protein
MNIRIHSTPKTKTSRKTIDTSGGSIGNEHSRIITPLKIMEPDTTEYVAVKAEDYLFANDLIYGGTSSKGFGNDATMEHLSLSFEKKPWSRLEMTIRIKKLTEWIEEQKIEWINLYPEKNEMKIYELFENLQKELLEKIRSGTINKQKVIIYNIELRKITGITNVHLDPETLSYRIEHKEPKKRFS